MDNLWEEFKHSIYSKVATASALGFNGAVIRHDEEFLAECELPYKEVMKYAARRLNEQEGYTAKVCLNVAESVKHKKQIFALNIVWFGLEVKDE